MFPTAGTTGNLFVAKFRTSTDTSLSPLDDILEPKCVRDILWEIQARRAFRNQKPENLFNKVAIAANKNPGELAVSKESP